MKISISVKSDGQRNEYISNCIKVYQNRERDQNIEVSLATLESFFVFVMHDIIVSIYIHQNHKMWVFCIISGWCTEFFFYFEIFRWIYISHTEHLRCSIFILTCFLSISTCQMIICTCKIYVNMLLVSVRILTITLILSTSEKGIRFLPFFTPFKFFSC